MRRTQQILMCAFVLLCLVSAGLYIMYTFLPETMPVLHVNEEVRFTTKSIFILLTLANIPFALRLFKFKGIAHDLHTRKAPALLKWGLIRMLILGNLLVSNILFYYLLEEEPTHGWLAVILILILPFIVPTKGRCEAEVTEEPAVTAPVEQPASEEPVNESADSQ